MSARWRSDRPRRRPDGRRGSDREQRRPARRPPVGGDPSGTRAFGHVATGCEHRGRECGPRTREVSFFVIDDLGARDPRDELALGNGIHEVVTVRAHDHRRYVDATDPTACVVPTDAAGSLGQHADVVAAHLVGGPLEEPGRSIRPDPAQDVGARGGHRRELTGHACERRNRREIRVAERTRSHRELGGCRAQHESRDLLRMAVPQQLGHGATHRIPGGHDRTGTELIDQGGDVVGAVGEADVASGAQPAGVAAEIRGDHVELAAE